jgi:hypothetical protein
MPRRKHVEIELDGIAKELGAQVYNEPPGFICILPDDVHDSVVGRGASVAEAVTNWDAKLQAHLRNASNDDPVVLSVKAHLVKSSYISPQKNLNGATSAEKSKHIIEFENQFYPVQKRN